MPELPELEVVRDVLTRRMLGQTITSAEVVPPGGPIVVRDPTGSGFSAALTGARFESVFLWQNGNGICCDQVRLYQRLLSSAAPAG
jgi:formamidopyrimidine-DNA glycosylase